MTDEDNNVAVDNLIAEMERRAEQITTAKEAAQIREDLARLKTNLSQPTKINLLRENGKIVGGDVQTGNITRRVLLD